MPLSSIKIEHFDGKDNDAVRLIRENHIYGLVWVEHAVDRRDGAEAESMGGVVLVTLGRLPICGTDRLGNLINGGPALHQPILGVQRQDDRFFAASAHAVASTVSFLVRAAWQFQLADLEIVQDGLMQIQIF